MSASAPDAPPLSETTIGCFISLFFWMTACIIRAIWSEAPPAPAATTISTGLVGSHAAAGDPTSISASADPAQRRAWGERLAIGFLLCGSELYREPCRIRVVPRNSVLLLLSLMGCSAILSSGGSSIRCAVLAFATRCAADGHRGRFSPLVRRRPEPVLPGSIIA